MGDRIAVLRDGILLQCDTPHAVFTRPENAFVAGFIGSPAMNQVTVTVDEHGGRSATSTFPSPPPSVQR